MIVKRIKKETGIDITIKSRRREVVELKALASYLLREQGLTFHQIGKELKLNHATIIHHLKIYDSVKFYNPKIQELEDKLIGKKTDIVYDSLNEIIKEKDKEIEKLKVRLEQLKTNTEINRLITLLQHEDIQEKFKAFLTINEKAKYYPKFN